MDNLWGHETDVPNRTCLRQEGNGTRMKLAWKKRKHIDVRIRYVVSFLVFFQANFILVSFPPQRKQELCLFWTSGAENPEF